MILARHVRIGLGAALITTVLSLAPAEWQQLLEWRRSATTDGEWWRLWSGHWVHYGIGHAALNLMVVVIAGSVAEYYLGARRLALELLLAAGGISVVLLWAAPELTAVRGLSALGVMLSVRAILLLWRHQRAYRALWTGLAILLVTKLIAEALQPSRSLTLPDGVIVVTAAHWLGAVAGLAGAMVPARSRTVYLSARASLAPN